MLVVVDTNIFISYLLLPLSQPAKIIAFWQSGKLDILTAQPQLDELLRVTRYPKIRERISPALAGRLINEIRDLAVMVDDLPRVDVSADPADNYLLAIASSGAADYLITGDKRDVLSLKKYAGVSILSVSDFIKQTRF
jgi:putative PIN family toxin of toxin-antitoxin system